MRNHEPPVITVTDCRVANYLIDHGCELIALEAIPERRWQDARMRFRGEHVREVCAEAVSLNLAPLTDEEFHRLDCMLALLTCVLKTKQDEGVSGGAV